MNPRLLIIYFFLHSFVLPWSNALAQSQTRPGTAPVNVRIQNATNETISHYWIDPAGREIDYGIIAPGSSVILNTFEQHFWRIKRTSTNETIAYFAASTRTPVITIATLVALKERDQPAQQRKPPPQVKSFPAIPPIQPQPTRPAQQLQPTTLISQEIVGKAIALILGGGIVLLLIRLANSSSVFIIGHWSKLIENLQASPKEFYTSVEEAIARRQIPAISNSRVDWKEGGLFTARREYLRVSREKEVIDICGAPYGTGYFVSWWHGELLPSAIGPTLTAMGVVVVIDRILALYYDPVTRLIFTTLALVLIFLVLGILINRSAGQNWVRKVLAIPVIGWLLDRLFLPPTYYRIDSASMFRAAIEQSVHEVIDQMVQAKGLRALTELERKPILRDFFQNLR